MPQSVYSWMGSPLHLILEDDYAINFNRAQEAFFSAQLEFKAQTGQQWNGEKLAIKWNDEELKAWNDMGRIINLLIEVNGGSLAITEEQMKSDFLVKL